MEFVWLVNRKRKDKWYHKLLGILHKKPHTWEQYAHEPMKILVMEYEEMLQTTDKEKLAHELLHVAAAAVHCYKHIKGH